MLVPSSKCQLVSWPFGTTEPFRIAVVAETDEVEPVVTLGAATSVKVWSAPLPVPALLVATSRKW